MTDNDALSREIEEIVALLDEAHGFAALSPAGRDNISLAIEKLEGMHSAAPEPAGWVNGAKVAAHEPLPLLHYTPTRHFDTPVYFSPSRYTPPATGMGRTEEGVSLAFVADCLRHYAEILRSGLVDGAGHYFPVDIDEAADEIEKLELELGDRDGWIVTSGDGVRFRAWNDGLPGWTEDRDAATRYARRADAEAVHAEDEDAWSILPYRSAGGADA